MTTTLVSTVGETERGVLAHFGARHPNLSWVHAHIDGRMPGRTWTLASAAEPGSWLVEVGAKFCFLVGRIDTAVLDEVARIVEPRRSVTVILPPDTDIASTGVPAGFVLSNRMQFRGEAGALRQALTEEGVAERIRRVRDLGLDVRPIVPEDIEQPLLRDTLLGVYGSAECFAAGPDLGFCAIDGDRVVSWMHPVVGYGCAELGHGTEPEHRRRGIPSSLVYVASHRLALAGNDVTGSFDVGLTASRKVAGYASLSHEHDYPALVRDAG